MRTQIIAAILFAVASAAESKKCLSLKQQAGDVQQPAYKKAECAFHRWPNDKSEHYKINMQWCMRNKLW